MSHLGDRLSALVDSELDGAERDRAHAHLASCERCRAEATELRALKQKLRGLMSQPPAEEAMTSRLIAMAGPGGPLPQRHRRLRVLRGSPPGGGRPPGRAIRRRRKLMLGGVCVVVGLGTAAFTVGGGGAAAPGPRITPPVEMYSVEHAITTGEVPFTGPSGQPASESPPGQPASESPSGLPASESPPGRPASEPSSGARPP
jgi:anti-sigma factor RsiW